MNKSEELAKLLGIYKVLCTEDEERSYTANDEICNNCDPDYRNCWSRKECYPDFTKPSNFVKLINLTFASLDGMEEIRYDGKSFVEAYIELIIKRINEIPQKDINSMWARYHHQAQQIDWEY